MVVGVVVVVRMPAPPGMAGDVRGVVVLVTVMGVHGSASRKGFGGLCLWHR
ncbi:hypothetical protein MASR2M50_07650 [Thauera sp.]